MKKFLFGCVVAASGFVMPFASANDYYCCPPQCDPCCNVRDFSGFYLGGNLGVFSHIAHRNDLDGFNTASGWTTIDTDVTAGVQVGYDWQCCNKLLGFVVDWNWVNTDQKLRQLPSNTSINRFNHNEFNWFTTIRARAGLTICDALVYVTGGAAVSRIESKWRSNSINFNHDTTRWGWTGGVGTEFLVWCNWSVGAEILFLHFDEDEKTFSTGGTAQNRFTFGNSDSAWIGRILVNYRFGDLGSFCCR